MLDYPTAARQSITLLAISFTLLVLINALDRKRNWRLR
jgi:ABC-type sulfate transport system permease component